MANPAHWFRLVLCIGALQAVVVGISLDWLFSGAPTPEVPLEAPTILATPLLATISVFLPFLAYAGDTRALLRHHPHECAVRWQTIGGLVGLSLSLAFLHLAVCIAVVRSDLGGQSSWLLLYRLLVPPLIVGGMGAAMGIIVAVLAHGLRSGAHPR